MTTANKITIFRVLMVPVFAVLLYLDFPGSSYWALTVFVLASVSDTADGYIARHYNQVTDFGKFLDPLADKVLVIAAMCVFVERGYMPGWALLIVVARELAVTCLRLAAVANGRVIAAAWSGKIKTTVTMFGIVLMLAFGIPKEISWLNTLIWVLILITTVWSGCEYFIKNRDVLQHSDGERKKA
mgnify:CR=1 FL=1